MGCRTFGRSDFIRVPSPAARMTTAAGRVAFTQDAPRVYAVLTFATLLRTERRPGSAGVRLEDVDEFPVGLLADGVEGVPSGPRSTGNRRQTLTLGVGV